MRRWRDDYGDCDVSPGDNACLCCSKIWQEKGYCQFIPVDEKEIREKVLKTLKPEECIECLKNAPKWVITWACGYHYPLNRLKWSGQTRLDVTEVTENDTNDTRNIGS